ncbi:MULTISPECIES: K+/H+ antiporter subunit F [Gemmobacter]|jgi:multicomponent K+:H+ antiporter subunit F|uniref:Multisubunit potassium/proton antiporter PhaF subunit n=2 Tax=Gemmobacter TaxID=204456 RepID=A0A2T6ASH9_9RHOB|nr:MULTISPECIES: K+/H+ antiporter subunit F [Gemmobacter]OJY25522.1 MAG: K+/H+ antiporter subunit F [Rhodobacterales bacterium 65-51]PTX46781.1 multisubunit potassium/proton antiporter PhaF subunit [Gemmobacter caeni]TWI95745.1 multicomponent K+:H+ antiporter subunit F [Gemmobacter caeni]GHC23802.1 K+/H+ antiporter subunit F [Gemmobacter nanjingensis]
MIAAALTFAFACYGIGVLICLWRVIFAPSIPDRVLALDTMVVNMIALIVIYGIAIGTGTYFEAAMLFAMTGFVSSVAYAKFILRGDIIE